MLYKIIIRKKGKKRKLLNNFFNQNLNKIKNKNMSENKIFLTQIIKKNLLIKNRNIKKLM